MQSGNSNLDWVMIARITSLKENQIRVGFIIFASHGYSVLDDSSKDNRKVNRNQIPECQTRSWGREHLGLILKIYCSLMTSDFWQSLEFHVSFDCCNLFLRWQISKVPPSNIRVHLSDFSSVFLINQPELFWWASLVQYHKHVRFLSGS